MLAVVSSRYPVLPGSFSQTANLTSYKTADLEGTSLKISGGDAYNIHNTQYF